MVVVQALPPLVTAFAPTSRQATVIIAAPLLKAAGIGAGLVSLGVDKYRERKAAEADAREERE